MSSERGATGLEMEMMMILKPIECRQAWGKDPWNSETEQGILKRKGKTQIITNVPILTYCRSAPFHLFTPLTLSYSS